MRKSIQRYRHIRPTARTAILVLILLLLAGVAAPAVSHAAVSAGPGPARPGSPLFDVGVHTKVTPAQAAKAVASPSAPTGYKTTVYVGSTPYTVVMAGRNPAVPVADASATVNAAIVPVVVTGSDGVTWDPTTADSCDSGASAVSRVQQSPLVVSQPWTWGGTSIGTGQLTGAFQRAEFWKYAQPSGINPSYGINLAWTTLSPVTITVPAGQDQQVPAGCGNGLLEEVSLSWLDSYLQTTVIPGLASQGVNPSSVPFFLLHNVVELTGATPPCCDLGYHSSYATGGGIQTYGVADYDNSGDFTGTTDISTLSHEIAEWQNDPYGTNPTPTWGNVGQAAACQGNLEVGDPLTGTTFPVTVGGFTYHPQELAFFSWFYHEPSGVGVNGWYSDQGTFRTFAAGCWGPAQAVPGSVSLNAGRSAAVLSVSCAAAANCSAGGYYNDGSNQEQAFVADEVSGAWGSAVEVPGSAALNADGNAAVSSVSCGSPGNCSAGGYYYDGSGYEQAFVADEVNGTWVNALEVPGSAALNADGHALVYSLSCASAGNCSAGGGYTDGSERGQAFVADEVNGTWGNAVEVPGSAALNAVSDAQVSSVSCTSAGNCSAVGGYTDGSAHTQALVADEVNGTWGNAMEVPGSAALNDGYAGMDSVSCASPGNCSAGGYYTDASDTFQVFVVDEVGGTWGNAMEVPGSAALNAGGNARVQSLSCASPGNCSAGGYYYFNRSSDTGAFVVSEVGGTWHNAVEVPGSAALNVGRDAQVSSVSCASAGNCTAGGYYADADSEQAFVVSEVGGTWTNALEVPGSAALNADGTANVYSVSCASAGNCSAGGTYRDSSGALQGLVMGQTS